MRRMALLTSTTLALFAACSSDSGSSETPGTDTVGGTDTATTDDVGGTVEDTAEVPDTSSGPKDIQIAPPDTGSDEDVVTAPAATCREAALCQYGCGLEDAACRDKCSAGAPATVTTPLSALEACLAASCKAETAESVSQCWLDQETCYDEFATCFFAGKSGATNCEDTSKCFTACKASKYQGLWTFDEVTDATECEDGCMQAADPESQYRFLGWGLCVAQFCNANQALGEDCEKNAPCGTQRELCISPN